MPKSVICPLFIAVNTSEKYFELAVSVEKTANKQTELRAGAHFHLYT